MELRHRL